MHYEDLTQYSQCLKTPLPSVRNVGWLDAAQHFPRGPVAGDFLPKLREVVCSVGALDVHVNKLRCFDDCSMCGEAGTFEFDGREVKLLSSELWIPGLDRDTYWVAPSLLHHYVDAHAYRPPQEFIEAVMSLNCGSPYNGQERYIQLVVGHS